MASLFKNKKGSEIPVMIFVVGVIILLFLTLGFAFSEKRRVNTQTASISGIQESYSMESTLKYSIDRALQKAIEKSYYDFASNGNWIYSLCSAQILDYKNLCGVSNTFDDDFQESIKQNFKSNIETMKGADIQMNLAAYKILIPLFKVQEFILNIEDNKAKSSVEIPLSGEFDLAWYRYISLGFFPSKVFRDYSWNYKKKYEFSKEFSQDIGLNSFKEINNVAQSCKSQQDIKICMENSILNFNINVKVDGNNVFFDLVSKKKFEFDGKFSKVQIKFYIVK